ncbi:SRPBCC family protein [Rhodococcus maanshanensis]|uniref:Polyketide cyclase / dehydrase and lipid transport n=1 Tax=Rhodococcus maanshanensis TaxID=183556 RepID=A0A1H7LQZ8_9NOCA|nr:SRPBCC family protein [Rhodococcus maanshanensis]SEL01336.1 Polyketide cyclase / dehydrase and lipid transport [Rhodococcus maanshanensis]
MTRSVERATQKVGKVAKNTADTVGNAGRSASGTTKDLSPLQESLQNLAGTLTERAASTLTDKVSGAAERLTDYAEGSGGGLLAAVTGSQKLAEGKSPLSAAMSAGLANVKDLAGKKFEDIKESFTGGKGKGKGGKKLKLTNIVEQIDVGVPVQLAYDQWTQFGDFPSFMKKVEQVEQKEDEKLTWTAKVFWSRRTWEATILEQVPDEHIIWRSKGDKGYIDGAVTFHELAPSLTRIIMILEYHPQGFFEKTGNLWRAQGRRARLELKHFQRHLMTQSALHPDEVEGWRGEIHDSEVVEGAEASGRDDEDEDEDEGHTDDDSQPRRRPSSTGAKRKASSGGASRSSRSTTRDEQPKSRRTQKKREPQK